MRANASILVGLLWCLALLSIAVFGVLHTANMDMMVVKNYGDRIQAHYLALAGVERAKALLYRDSVQRRQTAKNHTGALYDDESLFRDVPLGRGRFRVFHHGEDGPIYGITDEESRLDVNTLPPEVLVKVKGLTGGIASAIADWRGGQTNGPAPPDYYLNLTPPYLPRNAPFQTVRELLMVRGVEPDLLLGDDATNDDTDAEGPPNEEGWSAIFTVNSIEDNVNAAGQARVDLQTADATRLETVSGITPQIARAIIAARQRNQFQSVADLLDITNTESNTRGSGNGNPLIDDQLLMQIADDVSVGSDENAGLININTASADVLICLPGIDDTLARAIISYRESSGFFPNSACLLRVAGMTTDIYKRIAPLLTTRSETFRIICEGEVPSSGTRQRIQAIVHVGPAEVQTMSYREDL